MSFYGKGTFTGNYRPQGNKRVACIGVGHEYAVPREGNGVSHERMAALIAQDEVLANLPWLLNGHIADALEVYRPGLDVTRYEGLSTNFTGEGAGTKGEILFAKTEMLTRFGQIVPSLHLGHARHIPRIVLQAEHHGLKPITIDGYPDGFDPTSPQPQCRNSLLWAAHELVGNPYLRATKQF